MKVKLANTWYDTEKGVPVLLRLTPEDFSNIAKMQSNGHTRYMRVPDHWTEEQTQEWSETKNQVKKCKEV